MNLECVMDGLVVCIMYNLYVVWYVSVELFVLVRLQPCHCHCQPLTRNHDDIKTTLFLPLSLCLQSAGRQLSIKPTDRPSVAEFV